MHETIKDTLGKQLQLLSERSEKCERLDDFLQINQAICNTIQSVLLLERQIQCGRGGRAFKTQSAEPVCLDQNAGQP